jgi:SulP family sulfate permease
MADRRFHVTFASLLERQPLTRWELAGAFGDIGVLFPIAIALISLCHINPTAIFLVAGLAYILAGSYFRIPIPVQPFKAVAAIAIALHLAPPSIASAGLVMGILLLTVGLSDLATPLSKVFSLQIVRGIQLGLGLILIKEGLHLSFGINSDFVVASGIVIPGEILAVASGVILLALMESRRLPAALVLLVLGILIGLSAHPTALASATWAPAPLRLLTPRLDQFAGVLTLLVLPQFALTFGNSVVATEDTARILYGPQASRVTARALCISIGLMNLLGSLVLAAPCCHGSGGVTAHHKFGARTRWANVVIGTVCLVLALFGQSSLQLLALIPTPVLGVFLIYVGVQHAALVRDILASPRIVTAVCVGVVGLLTTNLTYGFLAGFALEGTLHAGGWVRAALAAPPSL